MFENVLNRLGIHEVNSGVCADEWIAKPSGAEIVSLNPSNGEPIARVMTASRVDYDQIIETVEGAFKKLRMLPAPQRGEIVREIGLALRESKQDLGLLVTLETGKIRSEGEGEVQEMIDMCDFAVGLSRQLYGLTMPSERPQHRLFEQWHPLGPVGIITAFNFPVAVWAWNATLAAVCGDSTVWKPSPHAPLTAIAVQKIVNKVAHKHDLDGVFNLCISEGRAAGEWLAEDRRLPLVSATGSCSMGRKVSQTVGARLGRCLLELGGNNAAIVTETADLNLALRAVVFAAAGTTGQRCTTLRRLFVHESIVDGFVARIVNAYESITIGDPWEDDILMGPLIASDATDRMMEALRQAQQQGGELLTGGNRVDRRGFFVTPAVVRASADMPIVAQETFAPILY
ncbi:MAG: aldehyde dehydrogenase family protein, partial [Planctomycetes bacterium]|nr:aldehyde dehydrogenase family protein [Planctomycetota bacterium]